MLYEVALVQKPSKKEAEEGGKEKLILSPTCIIAESDKSAGIVAVQQSGDQLKNVDLSNVEVLVRPFVSSSR